MKKIMLKIGCDGGCIMINSKCLNGVFLFEFRSAEIFTQADLKSSTFATLNDAWLYLKHKYPKWYQLYLIQISTQMTELVKPDYILVKDKNEYTIDSWMVQLTGRGIGF